VNNDPPNLINRGGIIRHGIDTDLDELRMLAHSGKEFLQKFRIAKVNRRAFRV